MLEQGSVFRSGIMQQEVGTRVGSIESTPTDTQAYSTSILPNEALPPFDFRTLRYIPSAFDLVQVGFLDGHYANLRKVPCCLVQGKVPIEIDAVKPTPAEEIEMRRVYTSHGFNEKAKNRYLEIRAERAQRKEEEIMGEIRRLGAGTFTLNEGGYKVTVDTTGDLY